MSELKHDFVRTCVSRLEAIDWPRLEAWSTRCHARGRPPAPPRSASPAAADASSRARLPLHQAVPRGVLPGAARRDRQARRGRHRPRLPRRAQPPLRLLAGAGERADRDHQRARAGIGITDKPSYREEAWAGADAERRRSRAAAAPTSRRRTPSARCRSTTATGCARQPHRGPGHDRAGDHRHLRQRCLRLRGRRPRLLRPLPQGPRGPRQGRASTRKR
jgi:hypothetical protein